MTTTNIRVFIVDNQEIVRSGLQRLLELEPNVDLVGEAETGQEALNSVPTLRPDVILMDVRMPGMDGVATTQALKELAPHAKIIMFSAYADDYAAAIAAGADGYLAKDISGDELIRALQSVAQGQSAIYLSVPRDELPSLVGEPRKDALDFGLSERQLSILRLLAKGETNATIAEQLFLSERTVKRELQEIYKQLDAANRAEAVACAYKYRLL